MQYTKDNIFGVKCRHKNGDKTIYTLSNEVNMKDQIQLDWQNEINISDRGTTFYNIENACMYLNDKIWIPIDSQTIEYPLYN